MGPEVVNGDAVARGVGGVVDENAAAGKALGAPALQTVDLCAFGSMYLVLRRSSDNTFVSPHWKDGNLKGTR